LLPDWQSGSRWPERPKITADNRSHALPSADDRNGDDQVDHLDARRESQPVPSDRLHTVSWRVQAVINIAGGANIGNFA
jgi:hypothetical protein